MRAVAAKNNRPDPLLTGSRPLKMRYKPDKALIFRSTSCTSVSAVVLHSTVLHAAFVGTQLRSSSPLIRESQPHGIYRDVKFCIFMCVQEQHRRSSPGHPPQHGSPVPWRDGSPQVRDGCTGLLLALLCWCAWLLWTATPTVRGSAGRGIC